MRPMPRPGDNDNSPSWVTSHAFRPRDAWYGLCDVCHLAESAHKNTVLKRNEKGQVTNAQGPWDAE